MNLLLFQRKQCVTFASKQLEANTASSSLLARLESRNVSARARFGKLKSGAFDRAIESRGWQKLQQETNKQTNRRIHGEPETKRRVGARATSCRPAGAKHKLCRD